MKKLKIKEKGGMIGTVTVRSHPAGTVQRILDHIACGNDAAARKLMRSGKLETRQRNIIVSSLNYGYDIIIQFLLSGYTGSFAFPLGIAWGEIGTGATQPMNLDTALTAPTNRAPVSYGADNGFTVAQLQFFFPDGVLANGTYTEFGTFVGGNSTIGTGNMFNHALFSTPYSKSSGVDTTVECDFSFQAAGSAEFDEAQFT